MLPTQKESPDQPKSLFLANAVDWMKVLGRTNLKIRPQDCAAFGGEGHCLQSAQPCKVQAEGPRTHRHGDMVLILWVPLIGKCKQPYPLRMAHLPAKLAMLLRSCF